ncbi:hypothetical protein HYT45_02935 [Candidatus Uhrbacteria bacterium]|nr:hypothetical protein [Candidatus Uhrbacteria bacterium]
MDQNEKNITKALEGINPRDPETWKEHVFHCEYCEEGLKCTRVAKAGDKIQLKSGKIISALYMVEVSRFAPVVNYRGEETQRREVLERRVLCFQHERANSEEVKGLERLEFRSFPLQQNIEHLARLISENERRRTVEDFFVSFAKNEAELTEGQELGCVGPTDAKGANWFLIRNGQIIGSVPEKDATAYLRAQGKNKELFRGLYLQKGDLVSAQRKASEMGRQAAEDTARQSARNRYAKYLAPETAPAPQRNNGKPKGSKPKDKPERSAPPTKHEDVPSEREAVDEGLALAAGLSEETDDFVPPPEPEPERQPLRVGLLIAAAAKADSLKK